jgi:hypothetical protein
MTVAGGLALTSGLGGIRASAQVPKRIEQLAPELDMIISPSEPIQAPRASGASSGRPKGRCGGRKAAISCSATSTTTGA